MLNVMSLRLRFQFATNVIRHLAVLLTFFRTIVLIFIALVINTGENQDVQDQQAAANRDCHTKGSRVSSETILRL